MLSPVFEALAGELVATAQEGAPDTSGNDVVETGAIFGNNLAARVSHGGIFAAPWPRCIGRFLKSLKEKRH